MAKEVEVGNSHPRYPGYQHLAALTDSGCRDLRGHPGTALINWPADRYRLPARESRGSARHIGRSLETRCWSSPYPLCYSKKHKRSFCTFHCLLTTYAGSEWTCQGA